MAETDDLKYETEDFNPRAIRWFAAGLAILTVTVFLSMGWLMWVLSDGRPPGQAVVTPAAPPIEMSPAPELQVAPARDYQEMRAAEETQLHSYGWIDRQGGIAAIPIERAMELLAQRGLPVQKSQAKNPAVTKEQP